MLKIYNELLKDENIYLTRAKLTINKGNGVKITKGALDLHIEATDSENSKTNLIIEVNMSEEEALELEFNKKIDISETIGGVLYWNKIKTSIRLDNVQILEQKNVSLIIERINIDSVNVDVLMPEVGFVYNGILKLHRK